MTNILLNNTNTFFSNNSENYRYDRIMDSYSTTNKIEQLFVLIAKRDLVHQLKNLVVNGLDVYTYRFEQGNTLLHITAQYDAIECVRYLIESGMDMNILSSYGSTPLENAQVYKAGRTSSYLHSLGAMAHITTLQAMIEASDIGNYDKNLVIQAVRYNDEIVDIIQNIKDFTEQMMVNTLSREKSVLFEQARELLMRDHIKKVNLLILQREQIPYHFTMEALQRYDLVRQQANIFKKFYLNQSLLPQLITVMNQLSDKNISILQLSTIECHLNQFI